MMRRFKKLAGIILPAFLVLTAFILAVRNYTPGTFLLGWDSLNPEFNFSIAFSRIFDGVWQTEQGMGAIAAHSYMADLPRIILLWLSSFVLPMSFLRYFYVFITLTLGPLGVYFFFKYLFQREKNLFTSRLSAFLGASFYLLNLITLQHFFVPFEMFCACFGFLPWVFYASFKFLREGKKRNLLFLIISLILVMPMAYAATLFYASIAGLGLFLLTYLILSKNKKVLLSRFTAVCLLILVLNSFWIGPNIYSIVKQSPTIENSKINSLFSPEAFLRNAEYGDIKDVLLGKSFLFSWQAFDFQKDTFTDLMGKWEIYLENPRVTFCGYLFAGIALLGLFTSLIKKDKIGWAFLPAFGLSLFFLFNINPPLGSLYGYFYDHSSLFREGLRMPFTKFSLLFLLIWTYYFGYFFTDVFGFLSKKIYSKVLAVIVCFSVFAALIYYLFPAFKGNFISPNIKRNLPQEYIELFDWFKGKEGRIAALPLNSFWGWEYHSWGYEGSGFLTYGLKNPLLVRDFDRWSKENENFYEEASFALYDQNLADFESILNYYQVRYLLLDESVINAGGSSKLLFIPETKALFNKSKQITKVAQFNYLTVYAVSGGTTQNYSKYNRISLKTDLLKDLPTAGKITETFTEDRGFDNANNCDLQKNGQVYKEKDGQKVIYRAENGGVACDFYSYPDLKHNQGYLLHLVGENIEGRSLKVYLQNYETDRMEVEELLPRGKFDSYYLVFPHQSPGYGYSLNLETRSFGRIGSENIIQKIEFIPVTPSEIEGLTS